MDLFCAPQRLAVARRCTACVTSFEHRTQREVCPAALCEPRQLRASSSAPNLSRSASCDQPLQRSQSGDLPLQRLHSGDLLLSSSPDANVSSARKPIPPTQLVDEFQTSRGKVWSREHNKIRVPEAGFRTEVLAGHEAALRPCGGQMPAREAG